MTVFDKADWHPDGSFEVIGRYLDWAIRRDLVAPEGFEPEHLEAIQAGEMRGTDLEDSVDGVLWSDMLSEVGAGFTLAWYPSYVDLWSGPEPPIGLDVRLDELFARWRAGEVPEPTPGWPREPMSLSTDDVEEIIASDHAFVMGVDPYPEAHDMPEAETLLPADLVTPPLRVESMRATTWGAGTLNRALDRLGVARRGAVVITGMGGPNGLAAITIYVVPGAPAGILQQEFRRVVFKGGGRWVERSFGGREVVMAQGHPAGVEVLFWAIDEHVIHLAGARSVLEPLVRLLPAGSAGAA